MGEFLTRRFVGRIASVLYVVSGLVTAASLLLPAPPTISHLGVLLVGGVAALLGVMLWFLPWERWPRRASLCLVPPALLLIAVHNYLGGADPYRYSLFFLVAFTWIGLTQPPKTSLAFVPLLVIAYLLPLFFVHAPYWAYSSIIYTVPVCILVSETLAYVANHLRLAQTAVGRSEERFRSLVQHASDIITVVDADARIQYQSPSVTAVLGYCPEDLLNTDGLAIVHPDDARVARHFFSTVLQSPGSTKRMELQVRHRDGSWRDVEVSANNMLSELSIAGIVINTRDITERKRAERRVRLQYEVSRVLATSPDLDSAAGPLLHLVADALGATAAIFWRVDRPTGLLRCLTCWQLPGCQSGACTDLVARMIAPAEPELVARVWASGIASTCATHDTASGSPHHLLAVQSGFQTACAFAIHGEEGILGIVECFSPTPESPDIDWLRTLTLIGGQIGQFAERKTFETQLAHQAFHDPLTNLPNRAQLMARLEDALARSRQGPAVAVLFLDLDNFKVVNDSLGHHVGDRLLVVLAAHLRQWLRPEDIVARLGGDEFMIVLGAVADLDEAIAVAERITLCLQAPLSFDGYEIFVTASIGVALSTPAHARAEDLVRDADIAMYRSKTSGKARSAVFDLSMNVHLRGRLEMETALRHAIDRHELEVHYQPVVDLATGRFSEVEALLRWKHPQHGMMAPTQFIPLAEETGLILPIGRWVLEETCRQVRQWQQHSGAASLVVSVNLSVRQLQHPELAEEITAILQATSLSPACLKLEITESAMMQEADTTIRTLRKLKHLGIQLAIDDFGTGYSSLAYLKRFPIDILKIDRSFVDQLGQNAEDTAIVQAIITLARTLNLCVTAEGIERADQLDMLRVLGCDHGQGYFFARPLPKDQLTSMLGASLQQKWQPARMPLSPMVA